MKIKLLSTWSAFASDSETISGIKLASHQRAVWNAIRNPDIQVVFDTALTGDGKTLAGLLPAIKEQRSIGKALFAYPTNELIRDQVRQFGEWSKKLNVSPTVGQLNGSQLSTLMREEGFDKPETLQIVASDNDIVLTNPDIFTLINRFYYDRHWGNIAKTAQRWFAQYRYIVFDEFHIFNAPQVTNVLDGIAFIRANSTDRYPTKFIFLSATPDRLLLQAFNKAGITPKVIRGSYAHGIEQSTTHRRILYEVQLELVASQQSLGGIENWVSENLQAISQFFAKYPESKGLIIANSVFAAKRIVKMLKEALGFNMSIGENTGLTGAEVRKEAMDAQLIVATSTVDVGVDFAINFLVYESLDAGSFIQRLGRLGRHEGFSTYKAIALVPEWVRDKFSGLYADESEIDRESFFKAVREQVYQKPQEFQGYISRWGSALCSLRYVRLDKQREQYQTLLERYPQEVKSLINETGNMPNWGFLKFLKNHEIIIKDLEMFRGAGQLDVWMHDPDTKAVTSMNLLRLLSGTNFYLIEEGEARQISERLNYPFYKNNLGLYACIESYLKTYATVRLHFTHYLDALNINEAQERKGFQVEARHPTIKKINDKFEYLPLTTCVADPNEFGNNTAALRRRYMLPALFDLQIVCDRSGTEYPVAFGLDALLLDSLLHWKKSSGLMMA
ncbi:MAG: type I-D CRISPR-associated helicase Cas3' [Leptolyngbyaceae cyanobacterium SU_3_3]|nr:type I-D CRISPR-associated helicase Cas3' [Leptolyngbyaceae cyanobacterium SU_3_3]